MIDRAQQIVDELVGTTQHLHKVMSEDEYNDARLWESVHSMCFICDSCGWWSSVDQLNSEGGGQLCNECEEAEA